MAFEISFNSEEKVIELRFYGITDLIENQEARKRVLKVCREENIRMILVNMSEVIIERFVSSSDFDQFGSTWGEDKTFTDRVFACVLPKDKESQNGVKYSASVGKFEGLSIEFFSDVDKAKNWLMSR